MSVIVSELITIGYLIIKWYLICYINIYLISSLLAAASWPNHPNYRPSSEIISSRMYLKSLKLLAHTEWFRSCHHVWWKGDSGKKMGKLCAPYVGVAFLAIHINLSPSQYWLVTASSVVWIEGWAYKQWKYIAGPGIEPETTLTLITSSTTEQPRRKSIHGPIYSPHYYLTYTQAIISMGKSWGILIFCETTKVCC